MLIQRIISGALLLIMAIYSIHTGGVLLWGVCCAVGLLGIREIASVTEQKTAQSGAAYAAVAVYYLLLLNDGICDSMRMLVFAAVAVGVAVMSMHVLRYPDFVIDKRAFVPLMIVYPGIMSSCLYLLRRMPDGLILAYLVMIASWGSDTLAYVTGMTLGKHHPFPVLSPKKSVEGCIGGIAGSAAIGGALAAAMSRPVLETALAAAVGAVASQLGDLAASSIKRRYGKKDYGHLIAGHGGVMDRFDSTLFAGALIYCWAVIFMR